MGQRVGGRSFQEFQYFYPTHDGVIVDPGIRNTRIPETNRDEN